MRSSVLNRGRHWCHHGAATLACLLVVASAPAATGVWEHVTPAGIDLRPEHTMDGVHRNGYAVQDVLADPARPGTFYAFVCNQGCWKSVDWGTTWTKASTDGRLELGRPWGEAIAADGSYMLACTGYNPQGGGGAWKSIDGGATWTSYRMNSGDNDPYSFDIDPSNKNHVIASTHSSSIIYESMDAGQTWASRGSCNAGTSNYVFFITSTTWLAVGQWGDGPGTWRTTNSGGTWTRVSPLPRNPMDNVPMEHLHGNEQICIDPVSRAIYVPSETGIYRSTDGGASFTQVHNRGTSSVFATGTRLYAQFAWATNGGGVNPETVTSLLSDGATWTPMATPAGMSNGAKRAAVAFNAATGNWVIISGNWNAGIWRFIEPAVSSGTPPTITALTPGSGGAGTIVMISGDNLAGTTSVTFNGIAGAFTVNGAGTQITATVPTGAGSGPIAVTTPGGTATSPVVFTANNDRASDTSSKSCGFGGLSVLVVLGLMFAFHFLLTPSKEMKQ